MTDLNYKLDIAYDGAKYNGWQRQKKANVTIQGKIESVLSKLYNEEIKIIGSGRTDGGVHALNQVANYHTDKTYDVDYIKTYLNNYLPEDIIIRDVVKKDNRFHSRFNAKSKTYIYKIWKKEAIELPLFERKYVYQVDSALNISLMREAAKLLEGEHDFKGFSSDKTKKSTIRTINSINIIEDENEILFEINGDGFLYNMVRIVVGTLLEISWGKRDIRTIDSIFNNKIRQEAGFTAPPNALFLKEVVY